jgi:hypothetical protein
MPVDEPPGRVPMRLPRRHKGVSLGAKEATGLQQINELTMLDRMIK